MGGGDLNSKKGWHPNTLKNQERVWKAEQAAAEEKKRIAELDRERHLERERAELNKLAKSNLTNSGLTDDRLHWMYEKPDKKVQQEEYLLGKAIEKNHDQAGKSSAGEIPAVSRRVVGSSMLTVADNTQVDLARKIREDPLLLVKERERAARAALLNNPVQRARLTQLLRNEQECKKESKAKKKKKKDLDSMLAEKLQALSSKKGIDLASLLASDDSSSESSDDKSKKKKQKKEKKRKRKNDEDLEEHKNKRKYDSKTNKEKNSSEEKKRANTEHEKDVNIKRKKNHHTNKPIRSNAKDCHRESSMDDQSSDDEQLRDPCSISKKSRGFVTENRYWDNKEYSSSNRQSQGQSSREELRTKHDKKQEGEKHHRDKRNRHRDISSSRDNKYLANEHNSVKDTGRHRNASDKGWQSKKSSGLSEEEKAAKLAEMVAAGVEREQQRERRVAKQLAEKETDSRVTNTSHPRSHNIARQLPDSLESRIHSNRHYIQRDHRHMNENFARR